MLLKICFFCHLFIDPLVPQIWNFRKIKLRVWELWAYVTYSFSDPLLSHPSQPLAKWPNMRSNILQILVRNFLTRLGGRMKKYTLIKSFPTSFYEGRLNGSWSIESSRTWRIFTLHISRYSASVNNIFSRFNILIGQEPMFCFFYFIWFKNLNIKYFQYLVQNCLVPWKTLWRESGVWGSFLDKWNIFYGIKDYRNGLSR